MSATKKFGGVGTIAAVALLGALASVGQLVVVKRIESDRIDSHYAAVADRSAQALARSFEASVKSVVGVAALFGSAPTTDRKTFARYAGPVVADEPTILNISWVPRVAGEQRAHYEELAQA